MIGMVLAANQSDLGLAMLPERSARRLQLEGDLHRALDDSQFVLHWQPKVHSMWC